MQVAGQIWGVGASLAVCILKSLPHPCFSSVSGQQLSPALLTFQRDDKIYELKGQRKDDRYSKEFWGVCVYYQKSKGNAM